jgi:hypothetical protein
MSDLFLRIRFWTKIIAFVVVAMWALLFLWNNGSENTEVWYLPFTDVFQTKVLVVILIAGATGGVLALLGRMLIFSGGQARRLREKKRADQLEREIRDMRQAGGKV